MAHFYPPYLGLNFTPTVHSKAEGPTDPVNNQLPPNYVVVITGAGKGLGYNIALAYAKAGASGISISSRTKSDLYDLTQELLKINPRLDVQVQICDTTSDSDVEELAEGVKTHFGRVDAVIANAGIISKYKADGTLPVGIDDDDFDRVISINLLGSRRVAKYFLSQLSATKDGPQVFVVITSAASHFADSNATTVAYNISKLGSNRLAEHIHNDHRKDGVLAFAVHPGAVLTPQTAKHSTQKGDMWEQGTAFLYRDAKKLLILCSPDG
jgi:NAD(P)-dependent dehydrogenase (short-subunit alcohol dehydrogenase family)